MTTQIGELLPEQSNAGSSLVSNSFSANVEVTANCNIAVTILWEGAGYRNSLGYFTYTEDTSGNVTITSSDLLEKNVSFPGAGSLTIGDTYDLKNGSGVMRTFAPGEKVGFFVIADGFRRSGQVTNWTYSMAGVPSTNPATNRGIGLGLYTSIPKLNPEFTTSASEARHLAMAWMPATSGFLGGESYLLCGFEDLNRTRNSDEDFNDLVFVVTANPIAAIQSTGAPTFVPGDPDGDGVTGINDDFPNDATRSSIQEYPTVGRNVLAFEDNYPDIGDEDYNDVVVTYKFTTVKDEDGKVVDLLGTFHLVARGASYESGFGLHIPGLPTGSQGTLKIERWVGGATRTRQTEPDMTLADLVTIHKRRILQIFPSTKTALPPPTGGWASNTFSMPNAPNAASARFHIHFTTPIAASLLGTAPYDPFLYMKRYGTGIWDIHLPGKAAFADRATHLPKENGARTFTDVPRKRTWALDVPMSWRYPLERQSITDGYTSFEKWVQTRGVQSRDWYLNRTTASGVLSSELQDLIPSTTWVLKVR